MAETITLKGDYDSSSYTYTEGDAQVFDASGASWVVANTGANLNLYPFRVYDRDEGAQIIGGTIDGQVSQSLDWVDAYVNSAAVLVKRSPGVTIEDWTISRPWDGIRLNDESDGFVIDNAYITEARDDAVESDDGLSGTIRNSLFDGVFVGVSVQDEGTPDSSDKTITLNNVLMRMESYTYKGEVTHGPPIKASEASPELKVNDTVIAIEDVDHIEASGMDLVWDKMVGGSGNVFLNLSKELLPDGYPAPPAGWIVLQGAEARSYWQDARDEWLAARDGAEDPVAADGKAPADADGGEASEPAADTETGGATLDPTADEADYTREQQPVVEVGMGGAVSETSAERARETEDGNAKQVQSRAGSETEADTFIFAPKDPEEVEDETTGESDGAAAVDARTVDQTDNSALTDAELLSLLSIGSFDSSDAELLAQTLQLNAPLDPCQLQDLFL